MGNLLILFVFCSLMFFVGNSMLQITDPVESNYALTAKEMLEAEDYFSPRIYGNYWYDKPILFYWELIAAFKLFGASEFAARLFPAIMASVGVFLTYFFAKILYDRRIGLIAAIILGSSLEYWYLGHAVITDMTLFVSVSLTLIFFYLGYDRQQPKYYYGAYSAAAVGVLTKGPIGFCLPAMVIFLFLLWQKDLRHFLKLRLVSGLLLFLAMVSLWYYPMFQMHGRDFIDTFLGVHNVLRISVSEHPEVNVWYYYLAVFFAGFFPWVFMVAPLSVKDWLRRRSLPETDVKKRFLLVWALSIPVLFQCFATKYLTYTLPYMMPIAILFALYFADHEKAFQRMAAGSIVGLNVCMFLVAAPLCEENSSKDSAPILNSTINDDTFVVAFGGRYPTSLVFYSGHTIHRTDLRDLILEIRPQAMKWTATNVMPLIPLEDLPRDKDVVALVNKEKSEEFFRLAGGAWDIVGETKKSYIYRRKSR